MAGRAPVLVVGEALVDIVRRGDESHRHPGGSPANVAITLGRRGVAADLLASVGVDADGQLIRDWLSASGVRLLGETAERTATATAVIDADGAASYAFDLAWNPRGEAPAGYDIVHTGSIATYIEPGCDFVHDLIAARAAESLITYDPNLRPVLIADRDVAVARIERVIAFSDVVKVSDEDLDWLCPGSTPEQAAADWHARGVGLVVVTMGAGGSVAFAAGGARANSPSDGSVQVIDTVGAGDSFMGALIAWLYAHGITDPGALTAEELTDLLGSASRTAAITVSRPGADPPWADELL